MSSGSESFFLGMHELQRRLGYTFTNLGLLESSLYYHSAHLSLVEREVAREKFRFESMEKLGDGVLKVTIQSILNRMYSNIVAGEISRRESILTCNVNLAHIAIRLQLLKIFDQGKMIGFEKKALADTMEAIFFAIAEDAGKGDPINGLVELRRVVESLFKVELATCQISNPYQALRREANSLNEFVSLKYLTSQPQGLFQGFVAKISFQKKLEKALGCKTFCGIGYTPESAREKASAVILLALKPNRYPSYINRLKGFSWKLP